MQRTLTCPFFRRAFSWSVPIGGLAGLIGLGGGEFRLPVLMHVVGFDAKSAVPLNLMIRPTSPVRRSGVTEALQALEERKLISNSRGKITIRDRKGLEEAANSSYGLPEAEYARLMGDPI
jgi:hypothetical protein